MARPLVRGTVLRARSGFYTVQTDMGPLECQLRGRLKRERATSELAVIGDTVVVQPLGDGIGAIEGVMPRLTSFGRRQPGPRGAWRQDLLVANVDRVLVVFACSDPIPHLRMVDRFLVAAEHNQIPAVLIVNKVDLCGEPAARKLFERYEKAGYEVHYVSGRTGAGVDQLRDLLGGHISLFTGPSGVGKSTLLNAIQPGM
ncbi:MAG: ribosome small subunit-dependent GTPase A, partial [Chloroflexota bacterium]|nr:ribosome small subunit-dependent GTPase A [Chloroflexota bacterium]